MRTESSQRRENCIFRDKPLDICTCTCKIGIAINWYFKFIFNFFPPILGLNTQGLYRISSAKSKMEKLCQLFEAGSERVDLSDLPPHLISSCLKLYFRQVGREREGERDFAPFQIWPNSPLDHGL